MSKRNSRIAKLMKEETPRHVKRRYIPTIEEAVKWFRIANTEIFGNKLSEFKEIIIRRLRGAWAECVGRCRPDKHCILHLNWYFRSKKHFVSTIIHEMVHMYQWLFKNEMTHGQTFYEWQPIVAKFGVKLAERSRAY